jgi:hypothetical protein
LKSVLIHIKIWFYISENGCSTCKEFDCRPG